jgi:hypothetical protein
MASGDFDGDGYQDALIGAYNYNDGTLLFFQMEEKMMKMMKMQG